MEIFSSKWLRSQFHSSVTVTVFSFITHGLSRLHFRIRETCLKSPKQAATTLSRRPHTLTSQPVNAPHRDTSEPAEFEIFLRYIARQVSLSLIMKKPLNLAHVLHMNKPRSRRIASHWFDKSLNSCVRRERERSALMVTRAYSRTLSVANERGITT